MSARRVEAYWLAMTPLQAEEISIAARVAVHPNTEKDDQTKWLRALEEDRSRYLTETKTITMKEFVRNLQNGRGFSS